MPVPRQQVVSSPRLQFSAWASVTMVSNLLTRFALRATNLRRQEARNLITPCSTTINRWADIQPLAWRNMGIGGLQDLAKFLRSQTLVWKPLKLSLLPPKALKTLQARNKISNFQKLKRKKVLVIEVKWDFIAALDSSFKNYASWETLHHEKNQYSWEYRRSAVYFCWLTYSLRLDWL